MDRRVNSSGPGFSMESLHCNVTSTFVNDVTPPFLPLSTPFFAFEILEGRERGGEGSFQRDYFSTFILRCRLVPESSYRNKPCLSVSLRGEINYRGDGEEGRWLGVDLREFMLDLTDK